MKATVVEIQSKSYHHDKKHRTVCLQFDTGDGDFSERLRIPEPMLGIVGIALDDVVDVTFSVTR